MVEYIIVVVLVIIVITAAGFGWYLENDRGCQDKTMQAGLEHENNKKIRKRR